MICEIMFFFSFVYILLPYRINAEALLGQLAAKDIKGRLYFSFLKNNFLNPFLTFVCKFYDLYTFFFYRFYNLLQIPMSISATEIGLKLKVLIPENSKSETFCRSHVCGCHRIHLTASAIICYQKKIMHF